MEADRVKFLHTIRYYCLISSSASQLFYARPRQARRRGAHDRYWCGVPLGKFGSSTTMYSGVRVGVGVQITLWYLSSIETWVEPSHRTTNRHHLSRSMLSRFSANPLHMFPVSSPLSVTSFPSYDCCHTTTKRVGQ